jgi:hypothetical protein
MICSANTDPELRQRLRWAFEGGKLPVFVGTVAEVAFLACVSDYELLRPVLLELKRRYPEAWRGTWLLTYITGGALPCTQNHTGDLH